jgi:hypothetical protein
MQKYFDENMFKAISGIFGIAFSLCIVLYLLTGCAQLGITPNDSLITAEDKVGQAVSAEMTALQAKKYAVSK